MIDDGFVTGWLDALRAGLPDLELFDAHTHLGQNDPDGFTCTPAELEAMLAPAHSRATVFPMHEPGGYPAANDAVIAAARESGGTLVAYCRLDPSEQPLAEATRALDAGAAGIKLHPRAEDFRLGTSELDGVFALADERRLPVLVHAGRGIPALGRDAVEICERHPNVRMILAHAGICDLAWIWRAAQDHPNLFFDTSWWSASDLLALFALVPPRHLLFASDAPYSEPAFAALINLRYALQVGLDADQLRSVFGGQLARILAGEDARDCGPAVGSARLDHDPLLDRVHTFLVAAIGQMFVATDPVEQLSLAKLACEVGEDSPHADVCATVLGLIELRERHLAAGLDDGRPPRFARWLGLIVIALALVRTPNVPLSPLPSTRVDGHAP